MFKEKDLDFFIASLRINPATIKKKRIYTIIFSLIFMVITYIYSHNIMASIIILLLGLVIYKYEYYQLKAKFKQQASEYQLSFISLFGYILVFMENGFNLYHSLITAQKYVNESIKSEVELLIKRIDENKTVTPYVEFGNKFNSQIIEQICILLYQLEQNGYDSTLLEKFTPLLEKLRSQTINEYIQNQSARLDIFGVYPLVGSVVITIALVLGILQSLAVIING